MRSEVLDLPGHCHRGAICVEFDIAGRPLLVIGAHLSLSQALRAVQMRIIGQFITRLPSMPVLIVGDLNEWRPWGGLAFSKAVIGHSLRGFARPSFPARRPILPLDRVLTGQGASIARSWVVNDAATTQASDHRPIVAEVDLPQ